MMRGIIACLLILLPGTVTAANLQLHYDIDREIATSTVEAFIPDAHGAWYGFFDVDYNPDPELAYGELMRYFDVGLPVNPTVQYNGGVAGFGTLGSTWLFGVEKWFGPVGIELLYRDEGEFQATAKWYWQRGRFITSGFCDLWTAEGDVILLAEPQLWFLVLPKLGLGGEVEISDNFIFGAEGLQLKPTVGARYSF